MNTWKDILISSIEVYEERIREIFILLDSLNPTSSEEFIKYIGYMYHYVFIMDCIGSVIESRRYLIQRFIDHSIISEFNDDERKQLFTICSLLSKGKMEILSTNIHSKIAFPSLPTLEPISYTGDVDSSQIYIAGLLNDFKFKPAIRPYVEKCITNILHASVPSARLSAHYERLLTTTTTIAHVGGFSKSLTHADVEYLINIYIEYLKLIIADNGERHNVLKCGKKT